MAVWYRRPLFCLCALFMISLSSCLFLTSVGRWIALGVIAAVSVAPVILFLRRRRWGYVILCLLAIPVAAFGFARFYHHFEAPGGTVGRFDGALGNECRVEAVVTDRRGEGNYMTTYAVDLRSVNGEAAQGSAILTCYYVCDLQVGYAVDMTAAVTELAEAASDVYDENAMLADGFCVALLSFEETDYTVTSREDGSFWIRLGALRHELSSRLTFLVREAGADKRSEGLPSAMLLGDRSALTDTVRRDFSRSGIAHLLAISGMHMTLLFGILALLLRLMRIPRRIRPILLSLLAGVYLFFLGFPPSATRAVIMLWAVYLSVVSSARADPLTSLGLAGAGILTCFPYAVMDVGFWMSFSATLGLVTLMPLAQRYINRSKPRGNRLLIRGLCNLLVGIAAGLVTGVVAMTFSMWITSVAIGEMSLFSPLATVLLTPALTAVILLSPVCLLLSGIGIGSALAGSLSWVCDVMSDAAAFFSQPSWAVVSLRHAAVGVSIAVMTVLLLVALAIRLPQRRRWVALVMVAVGWAGVFATLGAAEYAESDTYKISYLQPSDSSESLALIDGGEATVIDLSNGSKTAFLNTVREVKRRGATEVSEWVITQYTTRAPGSLCLLFGQTMVRALYLPSPQGEKEFYSMLSCMEKAELYGVTVYLYEYGSDVSAGQDACIRVDVDYMARSARPIRAVDIRTAKQRLLYCGAAFSESELAPTLVSRMGACDVLIFGNQGPIIKEPYGAGLSVREGATAILADELTAAWLESDAWIRRADLRMGAWHGKLIR